MSAKQKPASKDADYVDPRIQQAYDLGRQHQKDEDASSNDDAWYDGNRQAKEERKSTARASFLAGLGLRSMGYLTLATLIYIVTAALVQILSGNCS